MKKIIPECKDSETKKITEKELLRLLIKAYNSGFNKFEIVEAGLDSNDPQTECLYIISKYFNNELTIEQ